MLHKNNKDRKVLLTAAWNQEKKKAFTVHQAASDVFIPMLLSPVNEKEAAKEQRHNIFTGLFCGKFL